MSGWPRGKEPKCPRGHACCTGKIVERTARMCAKCYQEDRRLKQTESRREYIPSETLSVNGDVGELTQVSHERIRNIDELIRVCDIDTDMWAVDRWVCNKWEMGSTDKRKKPQVTALFQVKAWLRRKVALIAARDEIQDLIKDAKRKTPARAAVRRSVRSSGHMLLIDIPDLHVGKLAWAKETGWENYDSKIAERVHDDALEALIARTSSHRFDSVVVVLGNDVLHSDNKQGATTAGTLLDTDSRYHKSFGIVRKMLVRYVERCRSIAPVHALMVPGNHDALAVYHLGDSLDCYFHKTKDVRIDNAPTMRKYHQFGQTMFLFTHGNRGKLADYPQVMASEQRAMWGATRFHEAHTGDKHQTKVQEFHGVIVRISPALCPPDAWHAEHTFVGNARRAEAFVYDKTESLIAQAHYTVPTASEAAE